MKLQLFKNLFIQTQKSKLIKQRTTASTQNNFINRYCYKLVKSYIENYCNTFSKKKSM